MNRFALALASLLGLCSSAVLAWGNHSFPAYRAFERMPEVVNAAPMPVEPLESFLKAQEKAIEALLKEQEAWASANLEYYPPRPAALAFTANAARSDDARRLAFLMALRVAPNSKLALYFQPDPQAQAPVDPARALPHSAVNTLPEPPNSTHRFVRLAAGEQVSALQVIASASDEPDYGLDINLWGDSPSDWGKVYGFGPLSFGNPAVNFATQSPFHMGFFHESKVIYLAAPFLKKTFPLWRVHQYAGLAALAWRSGHPYWGWRFAGLALHYVQDLTQPYHASAAPGERLAGMLWAMQYVTGGRFFLHGVVSALVVLLLFDPVRTKVTTWISQFFFRERYEFAAHLASLRRQMGSLINVEDLVDTMLQGRFDAIISNLQQSVEAQSAARSRIMDADYAAETASLSRAQILQQAGNAMVAQANQLPQQVLSLLKG